MAGSIYDLVVNVTTNIASLSEGMARVSSTVEAATTRMATSFAGLSSGIQSIGKAFAAVAAAGGISDVILKDVEAFGELEQAQDRIQAQLTATGNVADTSVSKISAVAEQLAKTTTFSVQSTTQAASALLRFTNVTGDNFERTLKDSADLAAVLGVDIPEAAERLGKALENSAGATQLRRIGLLTDAQVKYLKALAAAGQEQARQEAILDIIEAKTKGVAEAVGSHGLASAWTEFTNALKEAGVQTGGRIAQATSLETVIRSLTDATQRYAAGVKLSQTATTDERVAIQGLMTAAAEGDTSALQELSNVTDQIGDRALTAEANLKAAVEAAKDAAGSDAHFKALAAAIDEVNKAAQESQTKLLTDVTSAVSAYDAQSKKARTAGQVTANLNAVVAAGGPAYKSLADAAFAAHKNLDDYIASAARAQTLPQAKEAFTAQLKSIQDVAKAQEQAVQNSARLDQALTADEIKNAQFEAAARISSEQEVISKVGQLRSQAAAQQVADARKQVDILIDEQQKLQALAASAPDSTTRQAALERLKQVQEQLDTATTNEALALQNVGRVSTDTRQAQILAAQHVNDQLVKANESYNKFLSSLDEEADRRQFEISLIDKTAVQQAALNAEYDAENRIRSQEYDLSVKLADAIRTGQGDLAAQLFAQINGLDQLRAGYVSAAGAAAAYKQAATDAFSAQLVVVQNITDRLATFLTDFAQHGSSAFKSLWDDFTKWALAAIAKVAAQQIVLSIIGSFNPGLANAAAGAFGQNPLQSILGILGQGGGALGGLGGAGSISLGSLGSLGGIFGSTGALGGELGVVGAGGGEGLALAGGTIAGGAGIGLASAIPYVGIAIAIASVLGPMLFKNEPSPAEGTFGFRSAGGPASTFEDSSLTTNKNFGLDLGFLDQGTQQFSGQAAQVFNKVVSGALDAFATRFSPEQSAAFATVLKNMTFQAFSGTYTTEDFIQKYGGKILQQVVSAAFQELDPAFGKIEAGFTGTADEVSKFSNSLLSIYDALNSTTGTTEAFKNNVLAAFGDVSTQSAADLQATADKLVAFVGIVQNFGTAISGLGPKLEALDPTSITAFIDALGGAQAATDKLTFLYQNFTTGSEKLAQAQTTLNQGFASLHLTTDDLAKAGLTAIPQTHAEFLKLLNSFDLTTDAGRQMYNSMLNLEQIFVTVHGTADQAATAVQSLSDAAKALSGSDLQNARDFFNKNFTSASDQQNARIAADMAKVTEVSKDWTRQLVSLGQFTIPTTIQGFHDFVLAATAAYGADSDFVKELLLAAPAVLDLNQALHATTDQAAQGAQTFADQFLTPQEQQTQRLAADQAVLTQAYQANSDVLKQLGFSAIPTTMEGFKSLVLSLQNSTDPAVHQLYLDLLAASGAVADMNSSLQSLTTTAQQGVGAGEIDSAAQKAVNKFVSQIDALNQQSTGDFGDKIGLKISLIQGQLPLLQEAYDKQIQATGGFIDATALKYEEEIQIYKDLNSNLSDELGRFTILKAQYGSQIAEQLVNLQDWYTQTQKGLGSNAEAMAALTQIFNAKWAEIIAGTSAGVTGTLDQLAKLRQGILDYADSLLLGDLSPLSPQDKLAQAQSQYATNLAAAQGGDQNALQNYQNFANALLTAERAVNGSSSAYTDVFQSVQRDARQLGSTFTDVAIPGTATPGTPATPAVVVAPGGEGVSTSRHQRDHTTWLKNISDKLDEQGLRSRQTVTASGDAIVTAIETTARRTRKQTDAQTLR